MSAIAGICYWDGRPVAESDLAILAAHSRAAGPDGGGTITPMSGLAMQAHVLHFDRLSRTERQPHVFGRSLVLTWDGRLDNRDDLLVTLHQDLGSDITDAALVGAAYLRWGLDSFPHLIGDWSLAIWDAPNRQIVLARDYMGNRPLYYLEVSGGLAWASSLDALTECFDLYEQPDECYIAGKLTFGVPPDLTPFTGVHVLRSGHFLRASSVRGIDVRRYWTFQPSHIRYRDPREYTDHLRVLLTEAVRVRLRATGRVWAHLSGGFDSSSIVCIAHRLIQRGYVEASELQPISRVVTGSPESDESPFISAVERWCCLQTVRRDFSGLPPTFEDATGCLRPSSYRADDILEAPMIAAGDRIVLSGELGDLVMVRGSSQSVSLLEPLHEGRVLQFLQLCFAWARRRRRPLSTVLVRLALSAYMPRLHEALQRRRRETARALDGGMDYGQHTLRARFTPALLARVPEYKPVYPPVSHFPVAKRALIAGLYSWTDHDASSNSDLIPGIWRTFSFSHRPLVDFVIGAPQLAFWDALITRAGMKRALATILPPEILARTSKGDPQAALTRAALAGASEFVRTGIPNDPLSEWLVVSRGYVHIAALEDAFLAVSTRTQPLSTFLLQCVQIEAWLRTLERHSPMRRTLGASSPSARDHHMAPRLPLSIPQ